MVDDGDRTSGRTPAGDPDDDLPADLIPRSGARRRHRRQTATFFSVLGGVLVLGLLAAAVYEGTLTWPFGGGIPAAASTATASACAEPTLAVQPAARTSVRVLNASTRRGLAAATARELAGRGFAVPDPPGNDPSQLTGVAVLRYGPGGLAAAHTVATQIRGTVLYEQDERPGDDVDLVLGQAFALLDRTAGAAALTRAAATDRAATAASCPPPS